jgi:hypothetical protein
MGAPKRTAKGRFQKLYLDVDDDNPSPDWEELDLVREGNWSATPQMEDVYYRRHGRHNRQESYGVELAATAELRVPEKMLDEDHYVKLRDAAFSGAPLHLQFASGPNNEAGHELLTGWFEVTSWEKSEPSGGHVVINVGFSETTTDDGSAATFTVSTAPA